MIISRDTIDVDRKVFSDGLSVSHPDDDDYDNDDDALGASSRQT